MHFEEVLPLLRRGARFQRQAWRCAPRYGLQQDRAGGHTLIVLGYGGLGPTQPWKTAALDILANDWQECEQIGVAPPRTQVD